MSPEQHVERIAAMFVGLPRDRQATLLVDAFCHEFSRRPEIPMELARPLLLRTVIEVFRRVVELEDEARRCSH